jgi:hypothetical protein
MARAQPTADRREPRSGSAEWTYVLVTIAAFIFTPELRRLVDWRGNYDPLNTFSVIPLLMLCPIAVMAFRRRHRLHGGWFAASILTWLAAFTYAMFVALVHRSVAPPLHGLAEFCLPASVGIWLMTRDESLSASHARIARALLIFGTLAAAYGIAQYVLAPPWDTTWMENIDATAFGTPERFGIRVFGVLNGPEVFGLFIGAVMLFNLPYLSMRSPLSLLAMLVMTIAMMLSLFRTAWIAVAVGALIFILLTPDRLRTIFKLACVLGVCALGVLAALVVSPDASAGDKILQRFSTLTDVQNDYSFNDRAATRDEAFQKAIDRPAGAGLGATGAGARLSSPDIQAVNDVPDKPIDNGFAARFLEMGVPGFTGFLVACVLSMGALVREYARRVRANDRSGTVLTASCIATQAAIFIVNFSDDDVQGLLGMLFFTALALPLLRSDASAPMAPEARVEASQHGFGFPARSAA